MSDLDISPLHTDRTRARIYYSSFVRQKMKGKWHPVVCNQSRLIQWPLATLHSLEYLRRASFSSRFIVWSAVYSLSRVRELKLTSFHALFNSCQADGIIRRQLQYTYSLLISLTSSAREAFWSWGSDFPSLPFPSSLFPSPPFLPLPFPSSPFPPLPPLRSRTP